MATFTYYDEIDQMQPTIFPKFWPIFSSVDDEKIFMSNESAKTQFPVPEWRDDDNRNTGTSPWSENHIGSAVFLFDRIPCLPGETDSVWEEMFRSDSLVRLENAESVNKTPWSNDCTFCKKKKRKLHKRIRSFLRSCCCILPTDRY